MSVRENAGRGKSYWGLVEQVGPWKETAQDRRNKSSPYGVGTGTPRQGRGGTVHAGHGSFDSLTIPGCVSGRKPPPKPSVYAQRSVVYKPLVFDGPRGVAGRIGARQAHLKGLGDRANSGSDQGIQTSGNVLGVGVPARQNLSEISQQEAIQQKSEMRLAELQKHNKVEELGANETYANKVFNTGTSTVRQTGTFGSAVGMTPHPGTEIVRGETVGDILGSASEAASSLAYYTAAIPVVGQVTAAGAAGLGIATGVVKGGEALGEGDVLGAAYHGLSAYKQKLRLERVGAFVNQKEYQRSGAFNGAASDYQTAEGGSSSAFTSNFSGYQPGVSKRIPGSANGASLSTDSTLHKKVEKWLDEHSQPDNREKLEAVFKDWLEEYQGFEFDDSASLAELEREFGAELAALMKGENAATKKDIKKILSVVHGAAVDIAPKGQDLSIVNGESVTFLPIKTGVSGGTQTGGGSKTQGTGTDNIYSFTKEFGTQADYTDAEKEKLKVELGEVLDALEAGKTEIVMGNVRMARILEIMGVDSEPFYQAVQRGEIDHASDLLREARETLGLRYGSQGIATDLTENDWYNMVVAHDRQKRQGGLAQVGTQTVFVPPRQNLVDQARKIRPREEGREPGPARAFQRVDDQPVRAHQRLQAPRGEFNFRLTANAGTQSGASFARAPGNLPKRMHPIENQHAFSREGNSVRTQTPHFG